MEHALEDNNHSAALDEAENDVALHTGETLEEYKIGDVRRGIIRHHFGQGGSQSLWLL